MGKRETNGDKRQRKRSNMPATEQTRPVSCAGAVAASTSLRAALSWSLTSKLLCFGLRTLIARRYGPAVVAFSDAYLGLLFAIALWPAREVVRHVVLQRPHLAQRQHWLWCNILWCIGTAFVFIRYIKGSVSMFSLRRSKVAYIIVGIGATLDASLGEWLHLQCLLHGDSAALAGRAQADALAALAQNIVALWITQKTGDDALGMSLGWFAQSLVGMAVLARAWRRCTKRRLPTKKPKRSQKAGSSSWRLWVHAALQAVFKFFASDAENLFFVLSNRLSIEEVGAYKLAGNLASLVLRHFFLPLEESVYIVAARLQETESRASFGEAFVFTLEARLCAVLTASLLACVGPTYVPVFLQVVYGKRWVLAASPKDALVAQLLTWYLRSLIAPALLGTIEAFATTAILPRLSSRILVVHASVNAFVSLGFVMGARWAVVVVGSPLLLIANNAVTMLLRAELAAAMIRYAFRTDRHLHSFRMPSAFWPATNVLLVTAVWAVVSHYMVSWVVARRLDVLAMTTLIVWTLVASFIWVSVAWRAHGPVIKRVLWSRPHSAHT